MVDRSHPPPKKGGGTMKTEAETFSEMLIFFYLIIQHHITETIMIKLYFFGTFYVAVSNSYCLASNDRKWTTNY
jgi:hypothetical protein